MPNPNLSHMQQEMRRRPTDEHVKIWIKKDGSRMGRNKCAISVEPKTIKLAVESNFSLTVRSNDFYIIESIWYHGFERVRLEELINSTITVKYENTDKKNFSYKYFHTEMANSKLKGKWTFSFTLSENTEPWLINQGQTKCGINTTVEITGGPSVRAGDGTHDVSSRELTEDSQHSKVIYILIVVVSIIGVILIIQSVYIIRIKKVPKRDIANRPPLPLPAEEVTEMSPSSGGRLQQNFPTAPPMPENNSYTAPRSPKFLKRTYGNEGLDISDEIIRSPKFGRSQEGPKFLKRTYGNEGLDISDEIIKRSKEGPKLPNQIIKKNTSSDDEPKLPGFIRKQIEDKLANLPPKPSKNPKPLPRAPAAPPPEKPPALNPATRTETVPPPPLPPLPQRKMPAYPMPASFGPDHHRLSDDEWQYEALKPSRPHN